jgi:hypothetical protein
MEVWLKNSSDIRSVSFIKKDIKELSDIFKDRHKPKTTLRANSTSTLKDLGMTNGQSYLEKPNFFSIR